MLFKNLYYRFIKAILCFTFVCLAATVSSQHHKYKAQLPVVDSSAFYKIEIPPIIAGKSKHGLADVRIINKKGIETPYIIKTAEAEFTEKEFEEFPILTKRRGADNQTHVVIENLAKDRLGNLLLLIKNTEAQRTVTLSGGEDTSAWYVIKENLLLENYFNNTSNGSFIQAITFPPVDYRFLKITILGKDVLPVNIIKAGIYTGKYLSGRFVQLPAPVLIQTDSSDKRSYIHLHFNETYQVDKLELQVTGPKYYKRRVSFYPGTNVNNASLKFDVTSKDPASFRLGFKAKDILLVIDNEDNPPLLVENARGWQLNKYLLSYLEKGQSYELLFGDSAAFAPAYDLAFFADSIPSTLQETKPFNVVENHNAPSVKPKQNDSPSIVLWIVIIAVLGLLLFASYKLMSDVERKKVT